MNMTPPAPQAPSPVGFALRFLLLFACLSGAFEAARGSGFEQALVEGFVVMPSVALIDAMTPGEHVEARGRSIVTRTSVLHVTRGCEGVELLILTLCAISAFPASTARKLRGLALGALLAYALTLGRLAALHYTLQHAAWAWEAMHGFLLPVAPVAALAWYFLRWTAIPAPPPREVAGGT